MPTSMVRDRNGRKRSIEKNCPCCVIDIGQGGGEKTSLFSDGRREEGSYLKNIFLQLGTRAKQTKCKEKDTEQCGGHFLSKVTPHPF